MGLSCRLTKALICGENQEKGETIHDLIFERQRQWIKSRGQEDKIADLMDEVVREAHLDLQDFTDCMKNQKTEDLLREAVKTGNEIPISVTPSFFINGKFWRGWGDLGFGLQTLYNHLN